MMGTSRKFERPIGFHYSGAETGKRAQEGQILDSIAIISQRWND